jgi:hypothetical protein
LTAAKFKPLIFLVSRFDLSNVAHIFIFKVKVTLRLTVSQLVSLGVEPHLGLMTRYLLLLAVTVLFSWGALSDERTTYKTPSIIEETCEDAIA